MLQRQRIPLYALLFVLFCLDSITSTSTVSLSTSTVLYVLPNV